MIIKVLLFILMLSFIGCKNPFRGKRGHHGSHGEQGVQGPKGDSGAVGEQGPMGTPGVNGKDGLDGATGLKGDKGDSGSDGSDGDDGTSTMTIIANAKADVTSQNDGRVNTPWTQSGVLAIVVPDKMMVKFPGYTSYSNVRFHHWSYIEYGHIRLCYQGSNQFDRSLEYRHAIDDRIESNCYQTTSVSHPARLANIVVGDVVKSSETGTEDVTVRVTSNGKKGSKLVHTEVEVSIQTVMEL